MSLPGAGGKRRDRSPPQSADTGCDYVYESADGARVRASRCVCIRVSFCPARGRPTMLCSNIYTYVRARCSHWRETPFAGDCARMADMAYSLFDLSSSAGANHRVPEPELAESGPLALAKLGSQPMRSMRACPARGGAVRAPRLARALLAPVVLFGWAGRGLAAAAPPVREFVIAPAADPHARDDVSPADDLGADLERAPMALISWMEKLFNPASMCPDIVNRWAGMDRLVKQWSNDQLKGQPPVGYAESGTHFQSKPPSITDAQQIYDEAKRGEYGKTRCAAMRDKAVAAIDEKCVARKASEWAGHIGGKNRQDASAAGICEWACARECPRARTRAHVVALRAGHSVIMLELACHFDETDVDQWLAAYRDRKTSKTVRRRLRALFNARSLRHVVAQPPLRHVADNSYGGARLDRWTDARLLREAPSTGVLRVGNGARKGRPSILR